jgi:hypothetical protein
VTPESHGDAVKAIESAFRTLLTEKHLYQSVDVDVTFLAQAAKLEEKTLRRPLTTNPPTKINFMPPDVQALITVTAECSRYWVVENIQACGKGVVGIVFKLPTINTYCDTCSQSPPFNPVVAESYCSFGDNDQFFLLSYQCQQCKGMPVRFLVRRNKFRLQLTGRDPFEFLPVPSFLPKSVRKYYADAQIARNAGHTLSGLFQLRVFIEQYWKGNPAVQELLKVDNRATGEKQGEAYQSTLEDSFKRKFPSLKEIYGKLSEAIHLANADDALFDDSSSKIEKHFDARRLFGL